ncbi:MAG: sigma 54-interacting transcriptional regulator, partial [Firmicutes bacterium]|nr:sigma 54-interacting transcriptional regulator [Bacillota bacterium]
YTREEVIGRHVSDLVREGYFSRSVVMQVLSTGQPQMNEQDYPRSGRVIEVTTVPLRDSTGKITHVVSASRDITELRKAKNDLLQTRELALRYKSEIIQLRRRHGLDGPVFSSKAMEQVVDLAGRASQFDATVLIEGESGVGKGVIARFIHEVSPRNKGPFVKVDCGAIPEGLLEAELFGYEGGAFTDARKEGKVGVLEVATGGTLFLDEIGNLAPSLQSKLLSVIQDREIKRLGGTRPMAVDVRFLVASRESLKELVEAKRFREDLYYRLNVIRIHVPPLRDRPEDILPITLHCLKKLNDRYGLSTGISPEAVAVLQSYAWPGNIRELENAIERALVVSREGIIGRADLPPEIGAAGSQALPERSTFRETMRRTELDRIKKAVESGSSFERIAREIGVHRTTVMRKARQMGLAINSRRNA